MNRNERERNFDFEVRLVDLVKTFTLAYSRAIFRLPRFQVFAVQSPLGAIKNKPKH